MVIGKSEIMRPKGLEGHVVAASVAQPRWQEMYGRKVFSAIVRAPSPAPLYFGLDGPLGNSTAVHTEQVFAFFAELYDYWAAELGVERAQWGDCHWGENLMLSGLREEDLHIGDRFEVGEAILEVTSPRIPCFKLCWRIGQPEDFLPVLIERGRTGCYFRVVKPGSIGAGDRLRRTAVFPEHVSVLGLSGILFDRNLEDLDLLRRIAAIPALGDQASGMIRKRIAFLTDERLPRLNRWHGWRAFEIDRIVPEARDVRSFYLRPCDGGPIAGYRAGQFLTVRLPSAAGHTVRTWSISDYDQTSDVYRITIRREPSGIASCFMHDQAKPGTLLDLRPPTGRFVLDRSGFMRTVLISAGIGVTPLLAMLKAHAERGAEATPLAWWQCVRSGADHAFAAEIEAALADLPQVERRIFYSQPREEDAIARDYDVAGRIDRESLRRLVTEDYTLSPFGRQIQFSGDNSEFYICGPTAFETAVREQLLAYGVRTEQIRHESFGPAGARTAAPTPERAEVRFRRSGLSATWRKDDDLTLLELAEQAGIAAESGCRSGTCGTCAAGILAGETGALLDGAIDPGPGRTLLCCTQPISDMVEIDL